MSSAARMTRVPLGTDTSTSSIVRVIRSSRFSTAASLCWLAITVITRPPVPHRPRAAIPASEHRETSCSCSCGLANEDGAALVREKLPSGGVHGGFELVAEVLDGRGDRRGSAVTERAEGPAENVVAEVEQLLDVTLLSAACLHPLQNLHQPPGALPARFERRRWSRRSTAALWFRASTSHLRRPHSPAEHRGGHRSASVSRIHPASRTSADDLPGCHQRDQEAGAT